MLVAYGSDGRRAVSVRHYQIHKHNIRPNATAFGDCLVSVAGFSNELKVVVGH
jgi:hypothetical protein